MERTDSIADPVQTSSAVIDDVHVVRVRVPAPLLHQLQDLLAEPAFGFRNLEDVIVSGLWSFANYKMRQIRRLREDAEAMR